MPSHKISVNVQRPTTNSQSHAFALRWELRVGDCELTEFSCLPIGLRARRLLIRCSTRVHGSRTGYHRASRRQDSRARRPIQNQRRVARFSSVRRHRVPNPRAGGGLLRVVRISGGCRVQARRRRHSRERDGRRRGCYVVGSRQQAKGVHIRSRCSHFAETGSKGRSRMRVVGYFENLDLHTAPTRRITTPIPIRVGSRLVTPAPMRKPSEPYAMTVTPIPIVRLAASNGFIASSPPFA